MDAGPGPGPARRRTGISPRLTPALAVWLFVAGLGTPGNAAGQGLRPAEPVFWAASGAAFAGAWIVDRPLLDAVQAHRSPAADRLADFGYEAGLSDNLIPVLATALVVSHLTDWPAESRRMLNVASGYAVANVITEGIKIAAGRGRPRVTENPRHFRPFAREGNWKSLPSGHASSAFGLMAALSREFDLPLAVEVLGYGLGGVVAWSRVFRDAHWPSDVVAGTMVGIAGARTTVAWLQRRQADSGDATPTGSGVAVPVVLVRIPLR